MVDYDLSIFPIFKSYSKFRKYPFPFRYKKLIQGDKFNCGVKIKNNGNTSFNGGIIKDIIIRPFKTDIDFYITYDKEFKIPKLDPGNIKTIWFGEISSILSGQFWLDFNLESKGEKEIVGFVLDIKDEHLLQQEVTNKLIIILTVLLLFDAIFGIGSIFKGILNLFG